MISIWKACISKKLCQSMYDNPDNLSLIEAFDNLKTILGLIESELGIMHPLVGECYEAIALIEINQGNHTGAGELLQKAYNILNNSAGQFDKRTQDVQDAIKLVRRSGVCYYSNGKS